MGHLPYLRCVLYFVGVSICSAQQPVGLQLFLSKWMEAVQDKDPTAYRKLIHPSSKTCLSGEKEDFITRHVATKLALEISESITLSSLKLPANAIETGEFFSYAEPPTHLLTVNLGSRSLSMGVLLDKGRWFEVLPCVSDKGMQMLRQQWSSTDRISSMNIFPLTKRQR
jgi:hypothetical protein